MRPYMPRLYCNATWNLQVAIGRIALLASQHPDTLEASNSLWSRGERSGAQLRNGMRA
jgi:hypothetical protein